MKRTKGMKRQKFDPLLPPKRNGDQVFADRKGGRPALYNKNYHCKIVYRLALLNLSEPEICTVLDISINVFQDWKRYHREFKNALSMGREQADAKVARALFRRAVGWGTLEEEVVARKVKLPGGGEDVITKVVSKRKRYPPDVQAISLWLRSRQKGRWTPDAAPNAVPVSMNFNFSGLTIDELKLAERIGIHAANPALLGDGNGHAELVE